MKKINVSIVLFILLFFSNCFLLGQANKKQQLLEYKSAHQVGLVNPNDSLKNVQTFPYDKLVNNFTTGYKSGNDKVFRIYISPDGDNSNGNSWATAYNQIQTGLNSLPLNGNGYTAYFLIKAGSTYSPVSVLGMNNYTLYFRWCGTFVDNASVPGTYSYWVKNGETSPIGNDNPITIESSSTAFGLLFDNVANMNINIDACDASVSPTVAGFAYYSKIILTGSNTSSRSLIAMSATPSNNSFTSLCGIKFDMYHVDAWRNACAGGAAYINLNDFELVGASGAGGDAVGNNFQGAIRVGNSGGKITLLTNTIGYNVNHNKPGSSRIYVTGIKQIFSDGNVANQSQLDFSSLTYDPGFLITYTPVLLLGTGFNGSVIHNSTQLSVTNGSTMNFSIKDLVTNITTTYLSSAISSNSNGTVINGNTGIGTSIWGTSAAKNLGFSNGTAPTSSPSNMVQMWASDSSGIDGRSSLYVRDEAGNVTLLSPHPEKMMNNSSLDSEGMAWFYLSQNVYTGKKITVDMFAVIRELEKVSNKKFIHIEDLPESQIEDWYVNQDSNYKHRQIEINEWEKEKHRFDISVSEYNLLTEQEKLQINKPMFNKKRPDKYIRKDAPKYMKPYLKKK